MAIQIDDLNAVVESYIKNTIREAHPEIDVSDGSVMDDIWVQPLISVLKPLIETINSNELQIDLVNAPFMSDSEIDAKGSNNYFIDRKSGEKATGVVAFQISDIARDSTFTIPAGVIVSTSTGIRFKTSETVRLSSTEAAAYYNYSKFVYDIPVPVEAEDVGSEYNVSSGEISMLETGFSNSVRGVNNYQSISGGTDAESNEEYLNRINDFYVNNFEGCMVGYKNSVYDARPDVDDLNIQGFRDKFMYRDKGYYYDQDGQEYEGNIGGKVDIYLKGCQPENYEQIMEVTNGLRKLNHLLLENIDEWEGNRTVIVNEANKEKVATLIKQIEYEDYSEKSKEEVLTELYSYNVPHTLHSYPVITYTAVAFADTVLGSGMSNNPSGKPYIGIAINQPTTTKPTSSSDYEWFRMNEEYGIQMPVGEDGKIKYIWVKYADDVYGTGMTDIAGFKRYIGIGYDKSSMEKSDDYIEYVWYKISDGITSGFTDKMDDLEYFYTEITEDTIDQEALGEQEMTMYYFYTTTTASNAKVYFNSDSFRIATMSQEVQGPIINGMVALENVTDNVAYDVFNYPDKFYTQISITPDCPEEDKITYKGTVLETLSTFFQREYLGFNGDEVRWTYSKNATIADVDDYINEENNRVITTDVLVRPAGVKYVNLKIRVKPADGVVLTDTLDDQITKVISDKIYDLQLGDSLDEAELISELYAGEYNIREYIDYIELPFRSIYPVSEDDINDPVEDDKRGDFARDLNDYDVPDVFIDNFLPIKVNELQYIQLNKLVIEEVDESYTGEI